MKYSPESSFPLNCIITHHLFGTGKVIRHIPPNKMDVKFGNEVRRLVCGPVLTMAVTASEQLDNHPPLEYFPDRLYPLECIISHKDFGIGRVVKYVSQNEINVRFSNGEICLKCGRLPDSLLKKYSSSYSQENDDAVFLSKNEDCDTKGNKLSHENIVNNDDRRSFNGTHETHSIADKSSWIVSFDSKDNEETDSGLSQISSSTFHGTAPMRYSPDVFFPLGCIITHPAVGVGKVTKHIPPNKMEVNFGSEIKTLVCGRISKESAPVNIPFLVQS